MKVIDVSSLMHFGFDDFKLENFNLSVEKGEIYALLGAGDSGKSLVFKLLSGLERVNFGKCQVLGLDTYKNRLEIFKKASFVPEISIYDPRLRAFEYLNMLHELRGLKNYFDDVKLIEKFGIDVKKPLSALDFEQKKLISLCLSLSLKLELCVFDNPFSYISDENIEKLKSLMLDYVSNGGSIFMTADKIKPLKGLASRFGRLKDGRIISEMGKLQFEKKRNRVYELLFSSSDEALEFSEHWEGEKELFDERVLVLVGDTPMPLIKLLSSFNVQDIDVLDEKETEDFLREKGDEFV